MVSGQMDVEWALAELSHFLASSDLRRPPSTPGVVDLTGQLINAAPGPEILASAQVVEQIIRRVLPEWREPEDTHRQNRWIPMREAALRCVTQLQRAEEVAAKLGDNAPQLGVDTMHPWVWEAARSLWQSGHYGEAVRAVAVKVNAEAQNKAGTRDLTETALFNSLFNASRKPTPEQPKLILPGDDGGRTAESFRRGVRSFAEGCFAALRNPLSHDEIDTAEAEALEQLAAFSILARWVDNSTPSMV